MESATEPPALPAFVVSEMEAFLKCGILANGLVLEGVAMRIWTMAGNSAKAELSLTYKPSNKAFQLHLNGLGAEGVLNFIGESGSPLGLQGQLYVNKHFIANPCVFQEACAGR